MEMKCDEIKASKIELTYASMKTFMETDRFWLHDIDDTLYIFDQRVSEVYEIGDDLKDLIQAKSDDAFNSIRQGLSEKEISENEEFLSAIIDIKDEPVVLEKTTNNVSVLKLNTSTKCNLSCAYCFREKTHDVSPADPALMFKAVENMVHGFGSDAQSFTVCFNLASEPLMNWDALQDIYSFTEKLQKKINKGIEIFFISNGTIASDASLKMIKKMKKDRPVSISIDGPKEVHDSLRKYPDGSGTYDQCIKNIQSYRKKGIGLTAEGVITAKHPYPVDIVEHLIEVGFERINLKPVRRGTPYSFDEKNIGLLKKGYLEYFSYITDELRNENYNILTVLAKDYALKPFWRILFNHRMNIRCGWGLNSISMDHNGDFYPCDSIMGMKEYRVGNVNDGIDWSKYRADLDCEKRGKCSACWARHICGGTCHVNGILLANNAMAIDPVECDLTKFLIESNLKMICELMNSEADMAMIKTILKINLTDIYML
jgi:uncharacterized protein